ncbi:HepT-like ribonuclease domain-containing protein [Pelagicoccus albus]|uniref:HepT-like ribonuclease domain-containing protein n=1 Tax=Pelagicoccus albus TaxID=415222 RepID=UPI003CCDEB43
MPHSTRKLLLDISLSCEEISGFIKGRDFEDFSKNRLLQLALEREFGIIGEALARLERID